jgi:DNA topoisomerase-1
MPKVDVQKSKQVAAKAGLRYVSQPNSGIHRRRQGNGFAFVTERGQRIRDPRTLGRIKALAVPPAWTDVWISPRATDHLQATGRDAKGRKQYRYHPRWNETRSANKYDRLIDFAKALPRIRRRVKRDLRRRGLPREKVLAAVVNLLETSLIRVGNEEYARTNHSFGLTTMRDRHAEIRGATIHFRFRGKSGVQGDLELQSPKLAKIVKRCQELPGQQLFQYRDPNGVVHDIDSGDVNDYLRQISGLDASAKDFRTWAGTALAAQALEEFEAFDSNARAKRNIVQAIERVAARLGNTTAVCRKCYVHPAILEAYLDRSLLKVLQRRTEKALRRQLKSLSPEEAAVLAFLEERMKQQLTPSRGSRRVRKPRAARRAG